MRKINTVAERIFTCDWLPIGSSRSDPCSLSLEAADICNHKEDLWELNSLATGILFLTAKLCCLFCCKF